MDKRSSPSSQHQAAPKDRYSTSDIRFLMVEIGKLSSNMERMITDVKAQGEKLDGVRHQVSFVEGGIWVIGLLFAVAVAIIKFV